MDSGIVSMSRDGQGWFQLKLRRSTWLFKVSKPTAHNSHLKTQRLLKSSELDTNASQACYTYKYNTDKCALASSSSGSCYMLLATMYICIFDFSIVAFTYQAFLSPFRRIIIQQLENSLCQSVSAIMYSIRESQEIAIAMSRSSHADSGLRVSFK